MEVVTSADATLHPIPVNRVSSSSTTKITYRELDVWIPKYNIGFEYQVLLMARSYKCHTHTIKDPHHYFTSHYGSTTLTEYMERDKEKISLAHLYNITLINVPFWWDFSIERYMMVDGVV